MIYFQGMQLCKKNCCLPSEKGGTLKGKNLLQGSKFFPFRVDPLRKRISSQETKQEVTKNVFLEKEWRNISKCICPFK